MIEGYTPASEAKTIPELIQSAALEFGDSAFLEEGALEISFSDFQNRCLRVAKALLHSGISHGDRIGVWAPNIHEWVIAALGAQCAGAVLVTLNTRYKGAEAAYILKESRAKKLFAIGDFLGANYPSLLNDKALPDLDEIIVFREGSGDHTPWEVFLERGCNVSDDKLLAAQKEIGPDDLSDILFTSGTTGSPKGVKTLHGQNLRAFSTWSGILGLQSGDRYLAINPFFHSFGYKAGILVCLMRGVTLLPHMTFDAEQVLKRIDKENVSVLPGPPTLFQSLLGHPNLDKYDISSLKRTSTGAASIPVEMIRRMKNTLGFETVITAYGLTECCGLVTSCRPQDEIETIATTSGRAIPDVEICCVDANGNRVPQGEAGEILVRGYNIMTGYFENEAATAETIDSDGWLHTGDVGVLDEQGNLRITDRLKDMFITGGFNCYPAEIENILVNHPDITMSAVIGIPEERMGEVAMAFVIRNPGSELTEEALIGWCRENMANFKVPRHVTFVEELPLNASGKVLKQELRNMARKYIV